MIALTKWITVWISFELCKLITEQGYPEMARLSDLFEDDNMHPAFQMQSPCSYCVNQANCKPILNRRFRLDLSDLLVPRSNVWIPSEFGEAFHFRHRRTIHILNFSSEFLEPLADKWALHCLFCQYNRFEMLRKGHRWRCTFEWIAEMESDWDAVREASASWNAFRAETFEFRNGKPIKSDS